MEERYLARNFTKVNAPPWVFLAFFKLCKWYQIAQSIAYFQQLGLMQHIIMVDINIPVDWLS